MTFAIIGGGPTGVEMAGAIAEIARYTLAKDFSTSIRRDARVILIEGDERVLSGFPGGSFRERAAAVAAISAWR